MIRNVRLADAPAIRNIYAHYVLETVVTFEIEPPSETEMAGRIEKIASSHPFLVWETGGEVKGYAYADRWKGRAAYDRTMESTIYLADGEGGRGIGTALYRALIDGLRERSIHAVIAGIALPNDASRRLHEGLDFRNTGVLREVGWKFNRWIDVGYWELIL